MKVFDGEKDRHTLRLILQMGIPIQYAYKEEPDHWDDCGNPNPPNNTSDHWPYSNKWYRIKP